MLGFKKKKKQQQSVTEHILVSSVYLGVGDLKFRD